MWMMRSKWFQKMKLAFKINHWLRVFFWENFGRILRLFLGKSRLGKYSIVCRESLPFATLITTYVKTSQSQSMQICYVERFFFYPIMLHCLDWCHVWHISMTPTKWLRETWGNDHIQPFFSARFLSNGFTSKRKSGWLFFMEWNQWNPMYTQNSRIRISHSIMECHTNCWLLLT